MNRWIRRLFFTLLFLAPGALCFERDNSPPILTLNPRELELEETTKVDTMVLRAYAQDNENDTLHFGLEAIDPRKPVPFRIDPESGVVYLHEPLNGKAGEIISFYVTVFDGGITSKNQVLVRVVKKFKPYQPFFGSPHSLPTHLLKYPIAPPIPTNITNYNYQVTKSPEIRRNISNLNLHPIVPAYNGKKQPHFVEKVPIHDGDDDDFEKEVETIEETTKQVDPPVKANSEFITALVPVLSVCGIFLIVALLGFMFRKKIYLGKQKECDEDMRKESSPNVILQNDPSMDMHHWRGPRAFSNRYEPWDREANHQQAENQLSISKKADNWEFPRHRLKFFNILGEGAFGQVWKCEAIDIDGKDGGHVVAVKTLKENATEKERTDLVSELQVMKMLEPHQNVVRLLGCCTEKDPIFVIMEYVSRGKLQSYLRNSRAERFYNNMHGPSKTLTSRDLTSFVYQVAKGMEYLSANGIIHRDLAARNILITEDHTCKVADFGFARDVIASYIYERKSEGRLPIRWMAPESLYDNIFSVKSDVWSFGVLMWEVVTLGSTPYPGMAAADVMRKVRDGYRLDKPEHCRRELYNIMYYCWDKEPKNRPTFTECIELLEKLLTTETDYIELERFPDHSYYNMMSLSGEKL